MSGNATTWVFDAEDGVYKNHTISGQLLTAAAKRFIVVPFTRLNKDFGKKKGEYITLVHWKPLTIPTSAVIDPENNRVPIDRMVMGTRAIKVLAMGRGAEYTSLMQDLSIFDPEAGCQKLLRDQMAEVMDNTAAAAYKRAKVIFTPTSLTGGVWDTDGTPSTAATENMTADHLGIIRDYMATNLHVPLINGDHYAGLFATKALRGLKSDKRMEAWNLYLQKGEVIYRSEAGRCEQVRMVESVNTGAFSNAIGTGNCTGQGVIFGEESVTRIEAGAPHLRANPNFQGNFGLLKACIWYGLVAFDTTWDSANDREAKIVRWDSA